MNGDPKTNTFKYFSYGSNLLRERILINNPTAEVYGIGKLSGYKLMFDTPIGCEHNRWYGAHATIRSADPDNYVCGVIWNVHMEDMENLDSQEAYYYPIEVQVIGDRGELVACRTYEMIEETTGDCLPSPFYKKEYIEYLESFPDNGVTATPPNYRKVLNMVEILNDEDSFEKIQRHENGI
ncbi:unnamed protein product [Candidula unifasciata]|uniref:gamma-glutamylcyclotransferase n=1 Tax=Candidula unifasciata TaxID=100452 RepID=A0A8S3YUP4_9EUPU|nr:unnamed protein product [Candidula unifasciata]